MKLLSVLAVGLMLAGPVSAQDYDKGLSAYNAGDYATALQEWTPLAEQGYASAQYNLSFLYGYGYGTPQDYQKAIKWGRLAAMQGDAKAQHFLGVVYESGTGVEQSNIMAHMWFIIASTNGNSNSTTGRDETSNLMAPSEITKAQAMASTCINSNYEDCKFPLNLEIDEIAELCKKIADMGSAIARLKQAGEDVEQRVTSAAVQILSDGANGELNKSVASKMVASITLGQEGMGTPDGIGDFIYNECINTGFEAD